MQEIFKKDLEGIKKSQSIMNSAIAEIISRITEAEERMSQVEDRMVEINEAEKTKD